MHNKLKMVDSSHFDKNRHISRK